MMPVDPTRKILNGMLKELEGIHKELHHIRQVFEYEYYTKPKELAKQKIETEEQNVQL